MTQELTETRRWFRKYLNRTWLLGGKTYHFLRLVMLVLIRLERRITRLEQRVEELEKPDGKQTEKHEHAWKFFNLDDKVPMDLLLCGQRCECGAIQEFKGPMYGWVLLKEGAVLKNEIT